MEEPRPLNELLREVREQHGQTLRQAAHGLGVSPAYLSRVERGEKPASPSVLARASGYYEIPEELLALSRGIVPPDIVAVMQRHPQLLDELRSRFGSR